MLIQVSHYYESYLGYKMTDVGRLSLKALDLPFPCRTLLDFSTAHIVDKDFQGRNYFQFSREYLRT